MTAQEYAFLVVAVIGSLAAIAVVTARNVVHAALYLVVALACVGITFLLVGAEFVGWTQILIYVGAIVILFLFGLMLTKAPIGRDTLDHLPQNRIVGAVVALLIFVGLATLLLQVWPSAPRRLPTGGRQHRGDRSVDVRRLRAALRGRVVPAARGADRRDRARPQGRRGRGVIRLPLVLLFAALLFSAGVYGVLARRNAVMVLMAIELMLNAVNLNLVAFSASLQDVTGQIFALFVIAVAAAEVGIGLAIVILLFRNRASINVDEVDLLKW